MNTIDARRRPLLPWLVYPGLMSAGFAGFFLLKAFGVSVWVGAYLPVAVGLGMLSLLEQKRAFRESWKPRKHEIGADLAYTLFVQILLPKAVALAAVLIAAEIASRNQGFVLKLWPSHWPLPAQVALKIVLADFARYWLHRAFHQVPFLWRFHAVHHAPQKLYALNVSRFHPLEKTVQLLTDTVPFMFLGMGQDALALFFVFYALHGFMQHCNADLRLGALNLLISGPELHRWHHSGKREEGNRNFANHLSLWDLLFGTRFLPKGRVVETLGLELPDSESKLRLSFFEKLVNGLIGLKMRWVRMTRLRRMLRDLKDPKGVQEKTLRKILRRNAATPLLRSLGIPKNPDLETYRASLPVRTYESHEDFTARRFATGGWGMTGERPLLLNQTSGTTARPKYIPVTRKSIRSLGDSQSLFAAFVHQKNPRAFAGKILTMVSPAIEGRHPSGLPIGSASGWMSRTVPKLLRAKYVLPAEVFEIPDYAERYDAIARFALAEKNLTLCASANPLSFLKLFETIENRWKDLVKDIRLGMAEASLKPNPLRADELEQAFRAALAGGESFAVHVWPFLEVVATWTQGSCGIAARALQKRLPPKTEILDLGYLSSEFRGTIGCDFENQSGLPLLRDAVYEFAEKNAFDQGRASWLGLEALKTGAQYYLAVTTPDGLYRYFMNDILEVTGFREKTPLLRFVQKGAGVTNITGEKISEHQVIESIRTLSEAHAFTPVFYICLANEKENRYEMYLESDRGTRLPEDRLSSELDSALSRSNTEYRQKRASLRLVAPAFHFLLPGTSELYKQRALARGQREAQFKYLAVQYRRENSFSFEEHLL